MNTENNEANQISKKERNNSYVRKFIANNQEKIKKKIQCPICYSTYTYFNKSKHITTKRHKTMINIKDVNKIIIRLDD